MNSTPLVSFVVPSYNYAHLLGQCVNSILAQDYEDFEVLIMDNCSPDNTPEVARSFQDPRIRYFRHDSNLGAEQNFNEGLKRSRGKYVWILSADDLLRSPRALRRCVEVMERDADVGFAFCRAIEFDGQTENIIAWAYCGDEDRAWSHADFVPHLLESNCVPFSSVLLRKDCLDRVGLFSVDLPFAADWYLWIKLAMHYGVRYVAEPLISSRVSQNSLTSQQSRDDYARICVGDELSVLGRIVCEAEQLNSPELADACRTALVSRSKSYLLSGLWGMARCMNASEFGEILQGRLRNLIDPAQIRTSVYRSLASDLKSFYNVPNSPISPENEITVFWDLWRDAKAAQVTSLCDACKLALAHRLACRIQSGLAHRDTDSIGTEFAGILQRHIPDGAIVKELRALICRDLGDQQYNKAEHVAATQSYRRALGINPFHLKTLIKYLSLKTGHFGVWVRKSVHQARGLKNALR